ncbi:hypothetical protein PTTG_06078 [Puccinia triticina 1-1 BBBD Race 1]|uniref:Uncharacterized protein n=1 Tax=Puccinia triticina (isolate 1-1 / race 1 (BBBD)) TaxID=630390 RepID=A0A0C4EZ23_PUCT1|nr:hypothetical protein PTTG_06078 [Puccinia triticina 1-1 BBBD Race 1]
MTKQNLKLDDPEELDDQSVLDIDLGPECCHPILAPAAPMETELHPSDLDGDVDVDNVQSDFVMDTCSNAEDLSASYASRRVDGNNDESALVIDPGPTAQDIARFQPNLTPTALSDPGITSLDHTRDDRNNNDQSNLIEVPLTAPRRPSHQPDAFHRFGLPHFYDGLRNDSLEKMTVLLKTKLQGRCPGINAFSWTTGINTLN